MIKIPEESETPKKSIKRLEEQTDSEVPSDNAHESEQCAKQEVAPSSKMMSEDELTPDENYSEVEEDVYSEPKDEPLSSSRHQEQTSEVIQIGNGEV